MEFLRLHRCVWSLSSTVRVSKFQTATPSQYWSLESQGDTISRPNVESPQRPTINRTVCQFIMAFDLAARATSVAVVSMGKSFLLRITQRSSLHNLCRLGSIAQCVTWYVADYDSERSLLSTLRLAQSCRASDHYPHCTEKSFVEGTRCSFPQHPPPST